MNSPYSFFYGTTVGGGTFDDKRFLWFVVVRCSARPAASRPATSDRGLKQAVDRAYALYMKICGLWENLWFLCSAGCATSKIA